MRVIIVAVLILSLYAVASRVNGLLRNIARAKQSGFRYIVVPWISQLPMGDHIYNFASIIVRRFSLSEKWLDYLEAMEMNVRFRTRPQWIERLGDAFLIVSPNLMVLHIANAELNYQVLNQRERFSKWQPRYEILRVFGPNIVTTEGHEWRRHRRLTAGSFTEDKTALVFQETVRQTLSMLRKWTGEAEELTDLARERQPTSRMLPSVNEDVTKLMLHIINFVSYGVHMLWPGETLPENTDASLAKFSSLTAPAGYQVAFLDAVGGVLHHIILVLLFPIWLLACMPFKSAREAGRAARDYLKYTNELLDKRLAEDNEAGPEMKNLGMDFLGQLVRTGNDGGELDRSAIIGNSFILQLAGHETTADALLYTIVFLACFPEAQRRLQQDLDAVLGDTKPTEWEYGKAVTALLASHVGAAMYETLRLMPPVMTLPKFAAQDQVVTKDGQQYTVPSGVPVLVEAMCTAMNPRYWPTGPSQYETGKSDIADYLPQRWFRDIDQDAEKAAASSLSNEDEEELCDSVAGPMMSDKLFRPVPGAYMPFSDGARSCIGRRMAQSQIMAALAVLYRRHSIELVVDKEDVQERSAERVMYLEARRKTLATLKTARMTTTLKLLDGQQIGLRIAKRGEERFMSWMD